MSDMAPPKSFQNVIDFWPSKKDLAADLGRPDRTGDRLVTAWHLRDSIPAEWFGAVVRAALAKPEPQFRFVTHELLVRLAENNRFTKEAAKSAEVQDAA